jgi:hypothetical protein
VFLHKKSWTFLKKKKYRINKCPACFGNAFAVSFTFLAHGTQYVTNFKWNFGAPYSPFHITLNVLDCNKLMENKVVCLCRTFLRERYSIEELFQFYLHGGLKTPRMDIIPHRMGRGPQSLDLKRKKGVAFGGTLTTLEDDIISLCTWMLSFSDLRRHLLSP